MQFFLDFSLTYNTPKWLQRLGVGSMEFFLYRDSLIFIHHPGQFGISKNKLPIKKNNKFYIDLSYEVRSNRGTA